MEQQLKILMLEDSSDDIELIGNLLKDAGINFTFQIAVDEDDPGNVLNKAIADIIIAGNANSAFNAISALNIYQRLGLKQPFIVLTNSGSIESAVRFVKEGAWDYITKDTIDRLPASIIAGVEAGKLRTAGPAAMQDVIELKNNEISISQLNNILRIKAKELANSNEELEKFAYITSHDLQEPLRMINGFLQLLKKKYNHELDETAHQYIDYAVDGAVRMKTLIFDLLEYSRIGSYREAHTIINLNEILSKSLDDLHASAIDANALISVPVLPEIWGNEAQITSLFQNLLSNALKYRAVNSLIEIGFNELDKAWEFFVKDNGIGIDPKYFKKIFIIFQRLHGRNEYNGTGIGLAICKKIVELHGGKIWVESSENGSIFYFTVSKDPMPGALVTEAVVPGILDHDVI